MLHHLHNLQVFAGVVGGPLLPWMGSGCGLCSPLGGVVLGCHRQQWVMGHGGEALSPLVVVRAIVGVDEGCWWVLVNGHVAALLLLLLRAVSVAPLSCDHCLSLSCRRRLLVGWVRLGWLGWGCSPIDEKNNESVIV